MQKMAEFIKASLEHILEKSQEKGNICFIRCIPEDIINEIRASGIEDIKGWNLYIISEKNHTHQDISSDKAVELREKKDSDIIFMIEDERAVGAGMDGIYSASREITENELYNEAINAANKQLKNDLIKIVDLAGKKAKLFSNHLTYTPFLDLLVRTRCINDDKKAGYYLCKFGYWPIKLKEKIEKFDLELSSQMVHRLFFNNNLITARQKVNSLLIKEKKMEQKLIDHLDSTAGDFWKDILEGLRNSEDLWINNINPEFLGKEIKEIKILPWKSKNGKPKSFSGLGVYGDDDLLCYRISIDSKKPKALTVKWKTEPTIKKNDIASYDVHILYGHNDIFLSKQVNHRDTNEQKCSFTQEDFKDAELLDKTGKYDNARIEVSVSGSQVQPRETEEFIILIGQKGAGGGSSAAKRTRALVETAIGLEEEEFDNAANCNCYCSKSYIIYNNKKKKGKIYNPSLVRTIEEQIRDRDYDMVGRWKLNIREDGTWTDQQPEFIEINIPSDMREITKNYYSQIGNRRGFMGIIYHDNSPAMSYIKSWKNNVNSNSPELSLANTIEVKMQDRSVGLIVLPNHFLRVAWHYAYDELVYYTKYKTDYAKDIVKRLSRLEGSYIPLFLPGTGGNEYIYGDLLNFYCVAMVNTNDKEPQASISAMARALSSGDEEFEPTSISSFNSEAISHEIKKYSRIHHEYKQLKVNAIYAGDGYTVLNALGDSIKKTPDGDDPECIESDSNIERFCLDLYPSPEMKHSMISGRYITELTEKRRLGVIGGQDRNNWIWETDIINNALVPKLRWSKQRSALLSAPAHITVAFDILSTTIRHIDIPDSQERNSEIYGLSPKIIRKFDGNAERPMWTISMQENIKGLKHPYNQELTDLLTQSHLSVLRSIMQDGTHPSLVTVLSKENEDLIRTIHNNSDWVIVSDKTGGLELFDSPSIYSEFFEKYIIDIVPENRNIENSRLIISTRLIGEIEKLLEEVLSDSGLECTEQNIKFIIRNIKTISGRMALILNEAGAAAKDIIAISYLYENCMINGWHSLSRGFFIPGDDIAYLLDDNSAENINKLSSILFYLSIDESDKLKLNIISIRFIRFLKELNEHDLRSEILQNLNDAREIFENQFIHSDNEVCFSINMKILYRIFIFFLEKARRHKLDETSYYKMLPKIEDLLVADCDNMTLEIGDIYSYLFCPQFDKDMEESTFDDIIFRSFGNINRLDTDHTEPPKSSPKIPEKKEKPVPINEKEQTAPEISENRKDKDYEQLLSINLGIHKTVHKDVIWEISQKSNPHMMIVGISGMGKTTCLRNICMQAYDNNIIPIIFSYHEDIDRKLKDAFNDINYVNMSDGLGFNPLFVSGQDRNSYLDNCGMIRDIFCAIFPDLGDLQRESIRDSVLKAYIDKGFNEAFDTCATQIAPDFQAFYDNLIQNSDSNKITPRFKELQDYGFFKKASKEISLLDIRKPIIIQMHKNQNDNIQRGLAFFMLFRIYQNMFLRGEADSITHMVIFDEAHRAKKLTLINRFARECRKYGISLILSSQSVDDFDKDIFASIANFLVLKSNEPDARIIAKSILPSAKQKSFIDKILNLQAYYAVFRNVKNEENTIRLKNV